MKQQAYPHYKESKIKWLGQIPEHWEVWKLSHGFQSTGSGTTPPSDNDAWYDGDIPWVTTSELRESIIFNTVKKVSEDAIATFSALKRFPEGSLAIAMYGATIGRLGIFGVPATTNQACCVMYGERALNTRFMFHWFQAFREQVILLASGGGQPNISQEKIRSIRVACPPLSEQTAIADFLDRKTERIDMLVAKKRQLIALLKEKRTSLISQTVTQGLPADAAREFGLEPHTRIENSSIEWLGPIPDGWLIVKFSREVKIAEGQVDPEREPYSSMILIGPEHVEAGTGRLVSEATAEDQAAISGKYFCHKGDVVYSKIRPALRKVVKAKSDCLCSADMYPLRGADKLLNDYIYWLFLSDQFAAWSVLEADRVAMPKINRNTLNELRLPVPSILEQTAIASYLSREIAKIDKLVEKIDAAIVRLLEYRTALITAAVTGKIDVREVEV